MFQYHGQMFIYIYGVLFSEIQTWETLYNKVYKALSWYEETSDQEQPDKYWIAVKYLNQVVYFTSRYTINWPCACLVCLYTVC